MLEALFHYRRFRGDTVGSLWGSFDSVEQARRAAPRDRPIGHAYDLVAEAHKKRFWHALESPVASYEWPVIVWLSLLFRNAEEPIDIFDFGGNVGIHWYLYQRYIDQAKISRWCVIELPDFVRAGEEIAARLKSDRLSFHTELPPRERFTVLLASSVIQYARDESLAAIERARPDYLLVNRVPTSSSSFVTLQNSGPNYTTPWVFNEAEFCKSITDLGYRLIDRWRDEHDDLIWHHYSDRRRIAHGGFVFERGTGAAKDR